MTTTPRISNPPVGNMGGAGKTPGDKIAEANDKAREAAASSVNKAQGVIEKTEEMASQVGKSVQGAACSIAHTAEDAYDSTLQTVADFNQDLMRLIHRHPKQAVGIAFGIGCLVGSLFLAGAVGASRRC